MQLSNSLALKFFNQISYSDKASFVQSLKDQLAKYKVIHLTDIPESVDLFDFYKTLNQSLGELIRKGEDLDQKKGFTDNQWLDVRYDKAYDQTFRHSNTRQPFHTDGAYISTFDFNIVFLFCTEQAMIGGETVFLDADQLVNILKEKEAVLFDRLTRQEVIFGKGNFGEKREKIIDRDETGYLLNWNYYRVSKENNNDVKKMTEVFHYFLEKEIFEKGRYTPLRLQKGECVYFYDRRVLHGRTAFEGNRCLIKGALNI